MKAKKMCSWRRESIRKKKKRKKKKYLEGVKGMPHDRLGNAATCARDKIKDH
jgi:hypothetical protein